ncbi:hypothetical protein BB560_003661, partial [Smittium megazygosporum]
QTRDDSTEKGLSGYIKKLELEILEKEKQMADLQDRSHIKDGEIATIRRKFDIIQQDNFKLKQLLDSKSKELEKERIDLSQKIKKQLDSVKSQNDFKDYPTSIVSKKEQTGRDEFNFPFPERQSKKYKTTTNQEYPLSQEKKIASETPPRALVSGSKVNVSDIDNEYSGIDFLSKFMDSLRSQSNPDEILYFHLYFMELFQEAAQKAKNSNFSGEDNVTELLEIMVILTKNFPSFFSLWNLLETKDYSFLSVLKDPSSVFFIEDVFYVLIEFSDFLFADFRADKFNDFKKVNHKLHFVSGVLTVLCNDRILTKLVDMNYMARESAEHLFDFVLILFHNEDIFSTWCGSNSGSLQRYIYAILEKNRILLPESTLNSEMHLLRLAACVLVVHAANPNQPDFVLNSDFIRSLVCVLTSEMSTLYENVYDFSIILGFDQDKNSGDSKAQIVHELHQDQFAYKTKIAEFLAENFNAENANEE